MFNNFFENQLIEDRNGRTKIGHVYSTKNNEALLYVIADSSMILY